MRQAGSKTDEAEQDARRSPRQRVSWLVTVAAGPRLFQGRTRDVSASGAKILLKERPPLGAEVALSFRPPGRRPVETRALVWRLDAEGLACMFVGTQSAEFLAAMTPRSAATPRATATARSAAAPAPAARPKPAGAVLLATAEAGVRALALRALGASGQAVLDAGPQPLLALRLAEEHRDSIAVILVAAELRLMNGEPLAKRLGPLLPSAKLLLMSSSSTPGPIEPGVLWLPTPCSDAELVARVREALDR